MSEDLLNVFSPVTQLASTMSNLQTKRVFLCAPARSQDLSSPLAAKNLTDLTSPSSDYQPQLTQQQNSEKVVVSGKRKYLRTTFRSRSTRNADSAEVTPTVTCERDRCQFDRTGSEAQRPMNTTPLSARPDARGRSKSKRSAAKCRRAEEPMDQENVPPPGARYTSAKNGRSLLSSGGAGRNLFGIAVKNAEEQRNPWPSNDWILSPISSCNSSSSTSSSNSSFPCFHVKRSKTEFGAEFQAKKMRPEQLGLSIFERAIAEADPFEATGFRVDDACADMMAVDEDCCRLRRQGQLNFFDLGAAQAESSRIESKETSRTEMEEVEKEEEEEGEKIETALGKKSENKSKSRTGNLGPVDPRLDANVVITTAAIPSIATTSSSCDSSNNSSSSSYYSLGITDASLSSDLSPSPESQTDSSLARIEEHYQLQEMEGSTGLPLVKGRRHDCNSISVETLKNVIDGEYNDVFEEYVIVDCRYPYEYEGGHVKDAVNIYTREGVSDEFMNNRVHSKPKSVLIFHCEFSSERGPRLMQHLRNVDRQANLDAYPNLYYPEVYLLDGGYKAFYEAFPALCEPQDYKPMMHEDHAHELRQFRAKSKSWAVGDRKGGASKGTKGKGIKMARRRCVVVPPPMETDEWEERGPASGRTAGKKNSRALFASYGSMDNRPEVAMEDTMDPFDFQIIDH